MCLSLFTIVVCAIGCIGGDVFLGEVPLRGENLNKELNRLQTATVEITDHDGISHLLNGNSGKIGFFASVGKSLNETKRWCKRPAIYNGNATIPSDIYHNVWIRASYTFDGQNVLGLVHDETHGQLLPNPKRWCPSMNPEKCWMTFATVALSTDGGYTFQLNPPESRVALSTSLPYVPDGGVMGVPAHSNLIRPPGSNFVYTMSAAGYNSTTIPLPPAVEKHTRFCLHRAPAQPDQLLGNHSAWRSWGGEGRGFDVTSVDPFRSPVPPGTNFTASHVCGSVDVPPMPWTDPSTNETRSLPVQLDGGSWTWSNVTGSFLKLGQARLPSPLPGGGFIFVYSFSPDGVHWTTPKPLLPFWNEGKDHTVHHYPSILDPDDGTANYEASGAFPYIWASENEPDSSPGENTNRNLVRWRARVRA